MGQGRLSELLNQTEKEKRNDRGDCLGGGGIVIA